MTPPKPNSEIMKSNGNYLFQTDFDFKEEMAFAEERIGVREYGVPERSEYENFKVILYNVDMGYNFPFILQIWLEALEKKSTLASLKDVKDDSFYISKDIAVRLT